MVKDARGWRCKFAVVAPSTNTIVQPDMDDFRVPGVTNHFGRIYVPNMKVGNDEEFVALVEAIGKTLYDAVDRCVTAQPDYLIMGMSALMFWDGRAPSEKRMQELSDHCQSLGQADHPGFCRCIGAKSGPGVLGKARCDIDHRA